MLIAVLFMKPINGASSWFKLGAFTIQPSEFAKFAVSLVLARYLSTTGVKIKDVKTKFNVLVFLLVPGMLILLQPDSGTMLVFFSFILVFYREGLSGNLLLAGLCAVVIGVISVFMMAADTHALFFGFDMPGYLIFMIILIVIGVINHFIIRLFVLPRNRRPKIVLNIWGIGLALVLAAGATWSYNGIFKERHRTRFKVTFGLIEDRKDQGYNIYQALSAIGSGGVNGKGYMQGTLSNDKYQHVPEQTTDFIFCSIAEEWGFLGCLFLIAVYLTMLVRIVFLAERQRSKFTRIFGYCTASVLFFHFMINIAMVIGLAPVIGIPLPFFSKGGSAVLGFSIMIFILLRLDAERKDIFG